MYLRNCPALASVFLMAVMSACGNTIGLPDPSPQTGGAISTNPEGSGGGFDTSTAAEGGLLNSGGVNGGLSSQEGGTGGAHPIDTAGGSGVNAGGLNSQEGGTGGGSGGISAGGSISGGAGGIGGANGGTNRTGRGGGADGGTSTGGSKIDAASCGDGACSSQDCASCSQACTKPVFTESDRQADHTFANGYTVFNNVWGGNGGPQTIYACSPSNWYVVSNQPVISNSRGEIKSYPCSKWDFGGKALNTFTSIASSFASSAPAEGVWNAAYDIWLGPGGWDIEVMVWTDYRYLATLPPGGAISTDSPTIDGISYYAWTYGSDYIGLAMKNPKASGVLNFRHIFDWIVSKRWLPADAQLHAFEYGIEIAETAGKNLTFAVTDFSVSGD